MAPPVVGRSTTGSKFACACLPSQGRAALIFRTKAGQTGETRELITESRLKCKMFIGSEGLL